MKIVLITGQITAGLSTPHYLEEHAVRAFLREEADRDLSRHNEILVFERQPGVRGLTPVFIPVTQILLGSLIWDGTKDDDIVKFDTRDGHDCRVYCRDLSDDRFRDLLKTWNIRRGMICSLPSGVGVVDLADVDHHFTDRMSSTELVTGQHSIGALPELTIDDAVA